MNTLSGTPGRSIHAAPRGITDTHARNSQVQSHTHSHYSSTVTDLLIYSAASSVLDVFLSELRLMIVCGQLVIILLLFHTVHRSSLSGFIIVRFLSRRDTFKMYP